MMCDKTIQELIDQISELQDKYLDSFENGADSKMLQGAERCIELKMKIYGLDGKQQLDNIAPSPEITIDLTKISSSALNEILSASKN